MFLGEMIFTLPVLMFQTFIAFSFWTVSKPFKSEPFRPKASKGKFKFDNTCNFLLLAVLFAWNVESFIMINWSMLLLWLQVANIGFWYGFYLIRNIIWQVSCIPNFTNEQKSNMKDTKIFLWLLISVASWIPLFYMFSWAAIFWIFPQPFGFIVGAGLSAMDS